MLDSQRLSEYSAARDFSTKAFRSACYAPHVSLYFGMVGDVLACCQNRKYPLGNVTEQSIDEIWRGAKARTLRERLEKDDFAAGCQVCQWQISVGNYENAYTRTFDHYPVAKHSPDWPRMMEFELSNTCNLECTMCYGFFSSLIRTNREHLPPLPKVYGDEFFRQLRPYVANLQFARFYGGEPFLAQETYRVWDIVVEDGLNFPCHVTTNGTHFNARVERVLEAMPVSLCVSLDAVTASTYESIRINAKFDVVMQNVRRFRQYCRERNTHFGFAFCLMQQNWREFGDVLLLAEELDCDVTVNLVYGPPHCNLYALPRAELALVADSLERQGATLMPQLKRNRRVWQEQVEDLRRRVDRGAKAGATPFDVPRTLIYRSTDLNATGRYGGWTVEQSRQDLESWQEGAEIEAFDCDNEDRIGPVAAATLLGLPAEEVVGRTFAEALDALQARYGQENLLTIERGPSHVDQLFEFHGADHRLLAIRVSAAPTLDEFDLPKGATALASKAWVTAADCPMTPDDLRREFAESPFTDRSIWADCDHALRITQVGGNLDAWRVAPDSLIGKPVDQLAAHFGAPQAVHCRQRQLYVERFQVDYVTQRGPWQILAAKIRRFAPDGRSLGWFYAAAMRDIQQDPESAARVLQQWSASSTIDRLVWNTNPAAPREHALTFLGLPAERFQGRSLEEMIAVLESRYGPAQKQLLEDQANYRDWLVDFVSPRGELYCARLIELAPPALDGFKSPTINPLGSPTSTGVRGPLTGYLAAFKEQTVLAAGYAVSASECAWAIEGLTAEFDAWAGAPRFVWAQCAADFSVRQFHGQVEDWPADLAPLVGKSVNAVVEQLGKVRTTRCLHRTPLSDRHELALSRGPQRIQVLGGRWRAFDSLGRSDGWLVGLAWRTEPAPNSAT